MDTIVSELRRVYFAAMRAGSLRRDTVFYCESAEFKQSFLRAHHGGDVSICRDATRVGSSRSAADCRGEPWPVPVDVAWVWSGPSCRDLSTLNRNGRR